MLFRSQVDPSNLDPCCTLVHEPRDDEALVAEPRVPVSSSQETRVPQSSSQETRVPESSSHVTLETSDHDDDLEETLSEDRSSESERVEEGKKVYPRGGTKLLSVPATRYQRWLIQPNGEK